MALFCLKAKSSFVAFWFAWNCLLPFYVSMGKTQAEGERGPESTFKRRIKKGAMRKTVRYGEAREGEVVEVTSVNANRQFYSDHCALQAKRCQPHLRLISVKRVCVLLCVWNEQLVSTTCSLWLLLPPSDVSHGNGSLKSFRSSSNSLQIRDLDGSCCDINMLFSFLIGCSGHVRTSYILFVFMAKYDLVYTFSLRNCLKNSLQLQRKGK